MTEPVIAGRSMIPGQAPGARAAHPSGVSSSPPSRAGRSRPYHLAVALSTAAGVYAVSLAAVTTLQAGTDAGVEAARRPAAEAITALRADHDDLEAAVGRIEAGYTGAADAYAALAAGIGQHENALGDLATITGSVEGAAASLPRTIALPALSRTTAARAATRPATNATTAASGKP
jgi:hypothetical protein